MNIQQGFVDTRGHRLAYLAVNAHLDRPDEEPAIVFIHGVLASINFWRDCVPPRFKDERAWYSLSLPGHHPSTVPDDFSARQVNDDWFSELMSEALGQLLGKRKAIVVGHSTGGYSALTLAAHDAPNVLGIISVAGFHSGRWGGVEGQLIKLAGLGAPARPLFEANLAIAKRSHLVRRGFSSLLANNSLAYWSHPLSEKMLKNIHQDVMAQDAAALFQLFGGIRRLEVLDGLGSIRMPCHLFVGTHDPVVPAHQSLALAGKIPGAKTHVFNGVGHMPFIEDSEAYFDALERAIEQISLDPRGHDQDTGKLEAP